MSLTATITADRVAAHLMSGGVRVLEAATAAIDAASSRVAAKVKENLSGAMLHVQSGKLQQSVALVPAVDTGSVIEGGVDAGAGDAFYGIFHEAGGRGSYQIVPREASMLHFFWKGNEYFRRSVTRGPLPKRPFATAALEESADSVVVDIRGAVDAAVGELVR